MAKSIPDENQSAKAENVCIAPENLSALIDGEYELTPKESAAKYVRLSLNRFKLSQTPLGKLWTLNVRNDFPSVWSWGFAKNSGGKNGRKRQIIAISGRGPHGLPPCLCSSG